MAIPNPRYRPGSDGSVLPLPADALCEILLRVPAEDLCRLRAVCQPWRCLLSDPHFIAAHAGRHPEPLIVAGCDTFPRNDGIVCDVMDLSGRVVKRIRGTADEWMTSIHLDTDELSVADMNGCLVVVHRSFSSNLDLWFLMNFERGIWVKQHSIQVQLSVWHYCHTVRPLLVLNDGRIVLFYIGDNKGSLRIYNPRTNISTDVTETRHCDAVGLYTGSPLSLAIGAS